VNYGKISVIPFRLTLLVSRRDRRLLIFGLQVTQIRHGLTRKTLTTLKLGMTLPIYYLLFFIGVEIATSAYGLLAMTERI